MKLHHVPFAVAAILGVATAAHAWDGEHVPAPAQVRGVQLDTICAACGVISTIHTETHNGQGSGVGAIGGAVVGGVLGHQIGAGSGRGVATAIGAIGGGFAGNAIEKKVKKETVWSATVTFKDGTTETFDETSDPGLVEGDVVQVVRGRLVRHAS
jgi:outer membrane lipoprotein SlyB